jgi:5'-phosphate synthase pdxT subunit
MIVLATEILDGRPDQQPLRAIDIVVRRNAFGRQVDSFESDLDIDGIEGGPVRGVFIRAPWVERTGTDVTVLARVGEHPVAVRQGNVLATSFHPEVSGDDRLHALFLDLVRSA